MFREYWKITDQYYLNFETDYVSFLSETNIIETFEVKTCKMIIKDT